MECDRKLCKIAQNCPCKCVPNAKMLYCTTKKKLETLDDLKILLSDCLSTFWEKDSDLIVNKVYEPVISGKFAMILFLTLYRDYPFFIQEKLDVDVEYNRCLKDPKTIHQNCEKCKKKICTEFPGDIPKESNIRPDIVFHKRLRHEYNKCVFEIKRSTAKNPAILESQKYRHDYAKLRALVCRRLGYKYKWGIHLTFFNSDTVVRIFQRNEIFDYKYDKTNKKLVKISIHRHASGD